MLKRTKLLVIPLLAVLLAACGSWDQTAYQTLAAAQGALIQAAAEYNAARIPKTAANRALLVNGQHLKDVAVNLLVAYEMAQAVPSTPSATLQSDAAAAMAALSNLAPVIASIQALLSGAPSSMARPPSGGFAQRYAWFARNPALSEATR